MAESASEQRQSLVERAKLAEQAEQYEDMARWMKEVVELDVVLTEEERNLLSVAYKNMLGARRSAWRVIGSSELKQVESGAEESDSKKKAVKWLREKVVTEMKEMCGNVLALLDKYLIPRVDKPESEVFYQKMKGDYFRYLTEISEGDEREDMASKAKDAYEKAHEKAAQLPTTNPVRLGLALNFSVFHYEIRNNPDEACRLAKEAFDEACKDLDQVKEESYKDSTLIMQLLRDNLTLWTSESEDQLED
ncbi:PREDICTED: 14-3-3-like protein [Branchiostoma belcheri]|uniref:14-3-3-like protein n=1 Tax=Branchiostoma belcheri TaxID=7741 RepID=A0A6P5ABQ7_BRABE|nr:PREDICTED: 14-3-3-like protein [Branchiostoma belcheri]XP_019643670.1 PREDICTED: 14-3-3-like protein [Branchiostoma belcheri]